jgi:hypothetical protein
MDITTALTRQKNVSNPLIVSNIEQPDDSGRSIGLAPILGGLRRAVPLYSFSIRNGDGSDGEFLGLTDLPNDYGALAFGSNVITDMLRDDVDQRAGWLMDIMDGERDVCSIVFPFLSQHRMRA